MIFTIPFCGTIILGNTQLAVPFSIHIFLEVTKVHFYQTTELPYRGFSDLHRGSR